MLLAVPDHRLRSIGVASAVPRDLVELCQARRPRSLVCLNVADPGLISIPSILSAGGRVHVIDWQPGRASDLVAGAGLRRKSVTSLRVTIADGSLGRAARFATRVEEMIACASSPSHAIELAHEECARCAELDPGTPLVREPFELVVSVLSPLDEAYASFAEAWRGRFGLDRHGAALAELRTRLFRIQIQGHALELVRLIDRGGCIHFRTAACEPAWDGGWFAAVGAPLAFQTLRDHLEVEPGTYAQMSACAAQYSDR